MSPPTPHLAVITLSCADEATATDATAKLLTLARQIVRQDEYVGSASAELFEIPVGRLPRVAPLSLIADELERQRPFRRLLERLRRWHQSEQEH